MLGYYLKCLQGFCKPHKISPFGTTMLSLGVAGGVLAHFDPSCGDVQQAIIASMGVGPSLYCFKNAYQGYFFGIKSIIQHGRVHENIIGKYYRKGAYCPIKGYVEAARTLGYQEEVEATIEQFFERQSERLSKSQTLQT